MAKSMTKSQIMKALADKTGLKKKEVAAVIQELVVLACKEAKNTFPVPGLGKLVLVQRPARKILMRFGPKTGQTVDVPAKKVLKFRIAKAAKDAVLKR
ncbi:MAG: HU family DNA-binding protein [Planctomycetes bacterium]|nr:HU family DNA-binding protein [Planctomycetota bacterium]